MDIIEINGQKCLHLSDLGLNAKLIKYYEKSAVHGRWGYALQIVKTLLDRNHPFKSTITLNNQTFESESRMIVIANAQKYGTGVVINPYGIMDDGKFELIILKKLDLMVFGKIVLGRLSAESEFVDVYSTDKAIIKTEVPISFQIDGEFCGTETELDISMSPYKVKIAVPWLFKRIAFLPLGFRFEIVEKFRKKYIDQRIAVFHQSVHLERFGTNGTFYF